jgi:hypothetical protein
VPLLCFVVHARCLGSCLGGCGHAWCTRGGSGGVFEVGHDVLTTRLWPHVAQACAGVFFHRCVQPPSQVCVARQQAAGQLNPGRGGQRGRHVALLATLLLPGHAQLDGACMHAVGPLTLPGCLVGGPAPGTIVCTFCRVWHVCCVYLLHCYCMRGCLHVSYVLTFLPGRVTRAGVR